MRWDPCGYAVPGPHGNEESGGEHGGGVVSAPGQLHELRRPGSSEGQAARRRAAQGDIEHATRAHVVERNQEPDDKIPMEMIQHCHHAGLC